MKALLKNLPEVYLLLSILYYWFASSITNWIAIALLITFVLVWIKKVKPLAIGFSVLFIILNLFMVLALFSELSEFEVFNSEAKTLLLVGLTYLGFNLLAGTAILLKHIPISTKQLS